MALKKLACQILEGLEQLHAHDPASSTTTTALQ
jgi:hypothetical protein